MRKFLFIFSLFIFSFSLAKAQDTLVYKTGEKVAVKVISVDKLNVYYTISPNESSVFVAKSQLEYVKYSNGLVYSIQKKAIIYKDDSLNINRTIGQLVFNLGIGYSPGFNGDIGIFGPLFPVSKNFHYYNCSSITPNMGIMFDYGINNILSVGLTGSYQSETVVPEESYFTDKITRINVALRILKHLNKVDRHFDYYIGVRFGSSYWQDIPTQQNQNMVNCPPTYFITNPNSLVASFQLLYGMRIYFSDNLGIHLEAGIGSPYLVEGGLTFRIKTRKEKLASTP